MKYFVTYHVMGRYTAEVEADSVDEAREKADQEFYNADFGELKDVGDGLPVEQTLVEDGDGKRLWEA